MKNTVLLLTVLFASAVTFPSCSDDCCMLNVNKICEEDLGGSGYATWSEYQDYLEGLGYNCK